MTDPASPVSTGTGGGSGTSLTRAFLFADLRDYTRVVETHGAVRAAELLERYRALVRDAVGRFQGSEIKTEGDSFYVVFDSVSAAVQCGLAIQTAAADASAESPDPPIRVGVGVHAGETVAVADGYVGSAVNVAARLCAQAAAGEVLVSDTVRSLTQAVLPVVFQSRGKRQLKGVAESVAVFAVVPAGGDDAWAVRSRAAASRRGRRRRIALGALVGVAAVAIVGVAVYALRPPAGLPPGPWKIGVTAPTSGNMAEFLGTGVVGAVRLAVDESNRGGVLGVELQADARDYGAENEYGMDGDLAIANARALAQDPRVIAMIGAINSGAVEREIPITNEAGLLQCSPAATGSSLTKPRDGALDLRRAFPDRINFIRTSPSDDVQGKATASFLYNDLGVRHLLVIDDTEAEGAIPAVSTSLAFEALGGQVTKRSLNPGAEPATVLDTLSSAADAPGGVFYGGFGTDRAIEIRNAMTKAGSSSIPFIGWDWIGIDPEFITAVGAGAVGSFVTHSSFAPPKSAFVERFRAAYGREPGQYDTAAYACMEVILEALRAVAPRGPSAEGIREAIRASAVDMRNRYETAVGTIGFDANGDSLQQFVDILRADPDTGAGPEWVLVKTHDYGPPA